MWLFLCTPPPCRLCVISLIIFKTLPWFIENLLFLQKEGKMFALQFIEQFLKYCNISTLLKFLYIHLFHTYQNQSLRNFSMWLVLAAWRANAFFIFTFRHKMELKSYISYFLLQNSVSSVGKNCTKAECFLYLINFRNISGKIYIVLILPLHLGVT